jgi:DNA-binding LacI/PurR family transcriptional regulator
LGDHLASLGHRRCLYLSGEADNVAYEARLKGFQETFLSHSRSLTVLKGGKDVESGRRMIQQALANGTSFTAVTGGNDTIAIGAMNELLDSGYRIPEEISVCGIDDVPFAENCRPALTTVRIEKQEMGIKALQYLLERLKNPGKYKSPSYWA